VTVLDLVARSLQRLELADIGRQTAHTLAEFGDGRSHLALAATDDDDLRTLVPEPTSRRQADPAIPTRHHRDLVV
jgi:hypothetical protein